MRLILCAVALTLFFASSCLAQTESYSPYSVYGIGMLYDHTSAINRNLSGAGIGIHSTFELNNINPASYAAIRPPVTHITELGALIESGNLRTSSDFGNYHEGGLSGLSYFFRIYNRWNSAVGIAPYSRVDYTIAGQNLAIGSGGVTQFFLGNGVQITKNLSIGFTGSLLFGSITKSEKIASGVSSGVSAQSMLTLRNFNADFGAQYTVNLEEDRKAMTLGVVYGPDLRFRTTQQFTAFNASGSVASTSDKVKLPDYVLPWHAGAGLSYEATRILVDADLTYRKMSEAQLGEAAGTFVDSPVGRVGLEYKGNPAGQQYWSSVRLRAGGYFGKNYLHLRGTDINEWGASLGVVLPVNHNWGQVSVSYNYNNLGTVSNQLIAQQANVIVVDITFRDRWGVRRKFD